MEEKYGIEAVTEFKKFLNEVKKKANKRRKNQIKFLRVSLFDKDLREKIKDILKDEERIEQLLRGHYKDKKELYDILSTIRQQKFFYVNLAQLRKQHRTNCIITAFTILVFLLMVFQIIISLNC